MRKQILFVLLTLLGWVSPPLAHAQFIGYTAPQTEQQQLEVTPGVVTNTCTGPAIVFPIKNLGQTQHYISLANVSNVTKLQAEIDGVDGSGNIYRISDVLEINGLSSATNHQGSLFGSGYYPKIQVQVRCSPDSTGTFTAIYSGAWGTFNTNVGSYLVAQIDKVNFFDADANAGQTDSFQTPFGSSAGTLYAKFDTGSVAATSVTITCNINGIASSTQVFTTALANSTSVQSFTVPDSSCPFATVTYATPGAPGDLISVEYVFSLPGRNNGGGTIGAVTQGTVPWVVSGTVSATQGTSPWVVTSSPSLSSTIISGQQAVTNSATALASNVLAHGICVSALSTNAASVFIGPSGTTITTGLELPAKASTCLSVSNSNAVFVVDAAGGDRVTWVGN